MSVFQSNFFSGATGQTVRFGAGCRASIAGWLADQGKSRAVLLTTPGQTQAGAQMAAELGAVCVAHLPIAAMHTPVEVTERALKQVQEANADCLIAYGGGSTIGLSKAISLRLPLMQVAVPTTFAGSEATAILGQTNGGIKQTQSLARLRPEAIFYDPDLCASLPMQVIVPSAMNAIAHAAEGLYARDRNPVTQLLAVEGMAAFARSIPLLLADPENKNARAEALYASWLCGTVLGQVSMALHHKLCHTLGGSFGLPHAETHAVILPHAIAYNAAAVGDLLEPINSIFGEKGLGGFARQIGAPLVLRDLGLAKGDLDKAADLACQNPYWNPRPFDRDGIYQLLHAAWRGDMPGLAH